MPRSPLRKKKRKQAFDPFINSCIIKDFHLPGTHEILARANRDSPFYRRAICEKEQGNQRAVVPRTHWVLLMVAVVCNSKEGNVPTRASTGQTAPSMEVGNCLYRLYFMAAILGDKLGHQNLPTHVRAHVRAARPFCSHLLSLPSTLPPTQALSGDPGKEDPRHRDSQRKVSLCPMDQNQKGG